MRQSARFRSRFYGGKRWRRLRTAKLRAAGWRCEGCHRLGQRLEIHHREPVGDGSPEHELYPDLAALACLCYDCHRARHPRPGPAVRGRAAWRSYLSK